jgi:hypothetical protein
MIHRAFSPEIPLSNVKLCKQCTHFQKAHSACTLFGRINLIDGSIDYAAASTIRDKFCREKYYVDDAGRGDSVDEPLGNAGETGTDGRAH